MEDTKLQQLRNAKTKATAHTELQFPKQFSIFPGCELVRDMGMGVHESVISSPPLSKKKKNISITWPQPNDLIGFCFLG